MPFTEMIVENSGGFHWICPLREITNAKHSKKLQEALADAEKSKAIVTSNIQFVDWLFRWLDQKASDISDGTLEYYKLYLVKHIIPYFEPKKLTLDKVLHYRFWINHSGRVLSISYCRINQLGANTGNTWNIRCSTKKELAVQLEKLFQELETDKINGKEGA